jgi:malonate-semialdehyde dehydrogenase (acetylating)/methylmalonate-semialdehyde dehydrogenase
MLGRTTMARGLFRQTPLSRSLSSNVPKVPLWIDGKEYQSKTDKWIPLYNPATNELLCMVPEATQKEMQMAVDSSKAAFKGWRDTPVQVRQRIMFKFQDLIRENMNTLAESVTREQGKTLADAKGDVFRGLEVVEYTCGLANALQGETLGNVAGGMDVYSYKEPLGVVAGICPFNFPAMIPLWMFPMGTTCGNTYVLKPSEKDPGCSMMLAKLAKEAGLPDGVLNIIHGAHDCVNFICDDPDIRAISFVGGNAAGEHIFKRGTALGKRVQSNMGAKNHATIMPNARKDQTLNAIAGAAFGAAGQRCMALSHALFVGESKQWIPELIEKAKLLKVDGGMEAGADIGPLISKEAKARAESLIQQGINHGAELLLDGRGVKVEKYPHGNFIGPTVLAGMDKGNPAYENEIFGPVLGITCVDTLDDAIAFTNSNKYGNGCAIFTTDGNDARHYQKNIDVGQVGINVPIPVPLPMFSFTGSRGSIRGDLHFYGKQGAQFYTQVKTITSNWSYVEPAAQSAKAATVMPTMGGSKS